MKSLKKLLYTSRSLLTLGYVFACSGPDNSGADSNAVGRAATSGGSDGMEASSGGNDTQRTNGSPSTAGGVESNTGGATTTKTATTATMGGLTAGFGGMDTVKNEPTGGSNSSVNAGGTPSTTGGTVNANGTSSSAGGTPSTTGGTVNANGTSSSVGGTASTTGGTRSTNGAGNTSELLAFPGAEGFGRLAKGARGGDVYHVTNLDDSGAGSLRDAISEAKRTVVFDVGGVINLKSRLIFMNNQTIAGQTAPGDGITLYGDGTSFSNANNTIVRYLRIRMGKMGTAGKDTVTVASGHDIIWDHCSLSWGRDGTFDLNPDSGATIANITMQDSIISQGLQTHSTGGLLVSAGTSVIRTLYIDNNSRNPKARGTTQFINNVVYNWVASGYILGDTTGRSDGALLGNYLISGPETNGGTLDSPTDAYHVYAVNNLYDSDKNGSLNGRLLGKSDFGSATWETTPSVTFPSVPVLTAQEAYQYVVAHAGASKSRDEVDAYVVAELTSLGKKGATISDETTLGIAKTVGDITGGTIPTDTDQDGMPDDWETKNGLNPNNAVDRNNDRNSDGWTNLEEYINSLAP